MNVKQFRSDSDVDKEELILHARQVHSRCVNKLAILSLVYEIKPFIDIF